MPTGGAEWGRFMRDVNPTVNIGDAFLENFKQGVAFRLAQEKEKRDLQMRKLEQQALEGYRNMQMQMEKAKAWQEQENWKEEQKRLNRALDIQKGALTAKEPTPLDIEEQKANIGLRKAQTYSTYKSAEEKGKLSDSTRRVVQNELNTLMGKVDQWSEHKGKFDEIAKATNPDDVLKLLNSYYYTVPTDEQRSVMLAAAEKRYALLTGQIVPLGVPNQPAPTEAAGGVAGGAGAGMSPVPEAAGDEWLKKMGY